MTEIHLYATLTAGEGLSATVADALIRYGRAVSAEPGTVEFRSYVLREDPQRFHVHEVYVDEEAFHAHVNSELASRFNAALAPMIVGGASQLTFLAPVETLGYQED